ncbi:FG-GAP-like repeat-containing protein [Thalassoglobus polymorphus]|uniref:FG-GAP repeat protein n=1 Tax=Thalassoglobus polymorphus TaxID=2527994 RepID=A0A517QNM2_9PLAN|nr:FG-GAP-like repeat-containing protein [Thalassoglobus polymorphus]QDT33240.1 FG-GAP repeat protein [Thalassoglobus polymorphus]
MAISFHSLKSRTRWLVALVSLLVVGVVVGLMTRSGEIHRSKVVQNLAQSDPTNIAETDPAVEVASQRARELHEQSHFLEAKNSAREAIRLGASQLELLLIACGVQFPQLTTGNIQGSAQGSAQLLIDAQGLMAKGEDRFALDLLRKVTFDDPNHLQAQGWYGQLLAKSHSPEFATWNVALPDNSETSDAIWFARGLAAEENGSYELAAKCYVSALERNPYHAQSALHLENVIKANSEVFQFDTEDLNRVQTLSRLAIGLAFSVDFEVMKRTRLILLELGDVELANAVSRSARQLGCQARWASQTLKDSSVDERSYRSRILNRKFLPAVSNVELPDWTSFQLNDSQPYSLLVEEGELFRDIAAEMEIDFHYDNGSVPEYPLGHLFETTGGGVTVVDYDLDGWPDLYFAQGGNWREESTTKTASDQLFRNIEGAASENVTRFANIEEPDFSQGVTSGDFNSDGFPDLYVCNLGGNTLYENQGDGTFLKVSQSKSVSKENWSLSAAFADFNQDGHPDLYVVNYLDLETVRNNPCLFQGKPRACPPTKFQGTLDEIYLNMGNGEFRELKQSLEAWTTPGKGMGLVIADLSGDGKLNVFVGNDGEENHYFDVVYSPESSLPRFIESAVPTGLATDRDGLNQATMGIAAGDADGDGRIDLFTTNFYGESNTLYSQHETDGFEDVTHSAGGLRPSSLSTLGFGTQFLDVDLDGDLDLFVANGHVDRTSVTGEPDAMLPQLYQNDGQGVFISQRSPSPTSYFQSPVLGRAVATLDWNRDGKTDLVVTHLDRAVALLQNTSRPTGNSITFHLTATTGERDAIGTKVTLKSGSDSWTQQRIAGNGYAATNENSLTYGLGSNPSVDSVVDSVLIEWPSGVVEAYHDLKPGSSYKIVEEKGLFIVP